MDRPASRARRAHAGSRSRRRRRPAGGLVGDRYASGSGKRGITLIQAEHLPVIAALAGLDAVAPTTLRRNVVVSGIPLVALKGRRFRIGDVLLEGTDACDPVFAHGSGARARAATTRCAAMAACARASSKAARCAWATRSSPSSTAPRSPSLDRPLHPFARTRKQSRCHQGHRACRASPSALGWTQERPDYRRWDNDATSVAWAMSRGRIAHLLAAGDGRARAARAGRFQPGCVRLRAGVAAGAGRRPVPDGAADAARRLRHPARSGARADAHRARVGRRADSGERGRALGRCPPGHHHLRQRQPPPGGARGVLRGRIRSPAPGPGTTSCECDATCCSNCRCPAT